MPPRGSASQERGKIVEFVGVAGAGKSTLCRFAREELARAGVRAVDVSEALETHRNAGFMAWFLSRCGRTSEAEARLDRRLRRLRRRARRRLLRRRPAVATLLESRLERIRTQSPAEAQLVRPWVLQDVGLFELLGEGGADWDLCLWEEGIALRLVNLFALVAGTHEADALQAFLAEWPLPDALVHVRVELGTAFERIEERGRPKRLLGATEEEVRCFLDRSAQVIAAILAEARCRGVPVYEVDNEESRKEMTATMSGWVECSEGLAQLADAGAHK